MAGGSDAQPPSNNDIDLLNMTKNLEHIILYTQYQNEQLFHIKHTEHNEDQVKTAQRYIQNSLNQ